MEPCLLVTKSSPPSGGLRKSEGFPPIRNGVPTGSADFDRKELRHPRAPNDYDEEAAYESYMNPEPGLQSGPGDSVDAD